jgi:hypothetical protein
MSLSAKGIRLRFAQSRGQDPLFAAVDGANCPNARTGNYADHSLLLSHGLIRIFLPLPANAQFSVWLKAASQATGLGFTGVGGPSPKPLQIWVIHT